MKKLLTLVALAGMFAFTACGPSAEEKAKRDQEVKDSIAAAETAAAEKAAAETEAAEKAAAAEAAATTDSSAAPATENK